MRLICPSCGAQYEVDAELIPDAGRDVQCSACGNVWFEGPAGAVSEEVAATAAAEPEIEAPATFAEEPPPVAPVRAPRRSVTPQIAEILREEAERERAARLAEAQVTLERQEELPLTAPEVVAAPVADVEPEPDVVADEEPDPSPEAEPEVQAGPAEDDLAEAVRVAMEQEAARVVVPPAPDPALAVPAAAIRPAPPPEPEPAPVAPLPRRDRLPDIEEINSTLRTAGERAQPATARADEARAGRGFRLGFSLVLLVAAVLALVYVYAPRIIAAAPGTEPVVAPYAAAVDSGRLWLDLRLQDLVEALGTDGAAEG